MGSQDPLRASRTRVSWDRIDPDGPGLHEPKREGDIGWDLEASETVEILAGTAVDIPTNVRLQMPDNVWAEIRARSSTVRRGLQVDAGTLDTGYRGPLFVVTRNLAMPFRQAGDGVLVAYGNKVIIEKGERIGQVIFHKVCSVWAVEVPRIDTGSERGEQGFGSTGK